MIRKLALGLVAAFVLAAPVSAQAPAALPTAEQFAETPTFYGASLSPSGRYLAGIRRQGDFNMLIVTDLSTKQSTVIQRANEESGVRLGWANWKTDDRLIFGALYRINVTARNDSGGRAGRNSVVDEYWVPRVMATARTGGPVVQMLEGQQRRFAGGRAPIQMVSRLPRDPDHVMLSAYNQSGVALWRANVNTGAVTLVEQGGWNTGGWSSDVNGERVLRIDSMPRNSGVRVFRRAPGAKDWVQFLEIQRAAAANQTEFVPIAASAEPGKIYVAARPSGQDRAAIYAFDAATGEYGPPLLSHPTADLTFPIVDQTTNRLLGACADVQRIECIGADPLVSRHLRAIDGFFERSAHFVVSQMSQDQNIWLLSVQEPATPLTYYLYDRAKASISPIIVTRESLNAATLAVTKPVSYKSRDGTDLWGYLTNAPAAGGPAKALIVMPHGGPEARDSSGFDDWAQFLATRGYMVFQPNFRGGAGFGRAFAEAGYRQWGKRMQDDVTDGVKHLIAAGLADPARVCIMGWSYGGYAALAGGALTPDLYKCVIAGAGPSDLAEMLIHERTEDGRGSVAFAYWTKSIGDLTTDRAAIDAVSPRRLASAFRAPVLLIHGDQDDIVPIEQSRIMRAALQGAGKDVRFVELKGEGHNLSDYESRVTFYKEIDAFLKQHLPPN